MRRLFVVLAIASSLGTAVPAYADPVTNANFVASVAKASIKFNDDDSAIKAGKTVCALMDLGQAQPDVVNEVTEQNPNITPAKADQFTVLARTAYCPQYLPPAP